MAARENRNAGKVLRGIVSLKNRLPSVRRMIAAEPLDLGHDWLERPIFVLKFAEVVGIGPVRRVHRL